MRTLFPGGFKQPEIKVPTLVLQLNSDEVLRIEDDLNAVNVAVSKWEVIVMLDAWERSGGRLYEVARALKLVIGERAYLLIGERVDVVVVVRASGVVLFDQGWLGIPCGLYGSVDSSILKFGWNAMSLQVLSLVRASQIFCCYWFNGQKTMEKKLMVVSEVQCTVLEVKVIEGLGTTIDVVLVNGVLHEGDQIVFCGMQGPIVTTIRALLTPHPMKELRVKVYE
ncbi:hypothetical protein AAC387_Pa02g1221 [Persea americana]